MTPHSLPLSVIFTHITSTFLHWLLLILFKTYSTFKNSLSFQLTPYLSPFLPTQTFKKVVYFCCLYLFTSYFSIVIVIWFPFVHSTETVICFISSNSLNSTQVLFHLTAQNIFGTLITSSIWNTPSLGRPLSLNSSYFSGSFSWIFIAVSLFFLYPFLNMVFLRGWSRTLVFSCC